MKNTLDKIVESVSPERALKRAEARAKLQVVREIQAAGYEDQGASTRKKSLKGWLTGAGSPNEDIIRSLTTLRARSRDLFMGGSPIATGALKTVRTNVVGAGLRLNSDIDYEYLGISKDEADRLERLIEREFALWADNRDCDVSRKLTFGQLQSIALLSALMNGDVFAMMPVVPRKNRTYSLRVQLIEADRVMTPPEKMSDENIVAGIEHGKYGEPVAYHIAKRHPGERGVWFGNTYNRVPAYGERTGRTNVLHIMHDVERVGQMRGVPFLAPVIEAIKQLGRYTEAELMAAVVSGMFTVFVKSDMPQVGLGDGIPIEDQLDEEDPNSYELGNGMVLSLGENESIDVANPGRPNTAFDGFVVSLCRQIGTALEIPHELLLKQFTASYSASRAALLEAWRMFSMRRIWMARTFCQPVYEEWLSEAVALGRIHAPGFFEDESVRAAWCRAHWYGPSVGQLDPLKEANAAKVRVEEGFSTREREAAELSGQSFESIHDIRVREEEKRREGGLTGQPVAENMQILTDLEDTDAE